MSLLNIYRYIESSHSTKGVYDTITAPGPDLIRSESLYKAVGCFWEALIPLVGKKLIFKGPGRAVPFIMESVSVTIREQMELMGSSLYATVTAVQG